MTGRPAHPFCCKGKRVPHPSQFSTDGDFLLRAFFPSLFRNYLESGFAPPTLRTPRRACPERSRMGGPWLWSIALLQLSDSSFPSSLNFHISM